MKSRLIFYLISLGIGIVYLSLFILAHAFLAATIWIPISEIGYYIFNIAIIAIMYVKDILDELKIHRGNPPMGPSWFEHSSFILVVAIQLAISIEYDTNDLIIFTKLILFFLAIFDFMWDISQDERSGSYRS